MFNNLLVQVLLAAVLTGIIIGVINYFWAKKRGEEVVNPRFLLSFGIVLVLYSGLFLYIQSNYDQKITETKQVYHNKMLQMQEAQKKRIKEIEANYSKEVALLEWKNKVFTSNSEMQKSLNKAKTDHELSDQEVVMWKGIAENNTLEKLIPKHDTKEVLKEYQNRLKGSLAQVKAGHTLMTSDVRQLADNINTIRLIGKEYEKVLDSFKELYNNINSNSTNEMIMPKQKKFLFFPVKSKEYNKLLNDYYEAKGNTKAMGEVAVKLKQTIDKAESEFKAINQKFEDNLSFVENTSNSITFNADKLQNLIEATINEANIINESDNKMNIQVKQPKKN